MNYDSTQSISNWHEFDFTNHTDSTDRNLITDISQTLDSLSAKSRAKRRCRKLREDLVREHIEEKQRPASFIKSKFVKLFKWWDSF